MQAPGSPALRSVLVTLNLTLAQSDGVYLSTLDLSGNDMVLLGGNLSATAAEIASAFAATAGLNWFGYGITSSAAASNTTHLTGLGVIQNSVNGTTTGAPLCNSSNPFDGISPPASAVLVKYTYYGDANLDGKVDASDYSRIDNGFLSQATGRFNGDFNYDGVINGNDYTLIDNALNTQGASLAATIAAAPAPNRAASRVLPSNFALFQTQAAITSTGPMPLSIEESMQK
jgi:hypothetical protein